MESTPGLDDPRAHTPASAMGYAPTPSSSALQNGQPSEHTPGPGAPSASGQQKFSNGPHIRSRITVVCAECKRLKLKCDRRTPCSSCLKRDTVQRCVYSQAAAEKVDVQTLHNRIIEIEKVLAQLQAAPSSMPVSAALAGIPTFKQTNAIAGPSRAGPIPPSTSSLMAGFPCNDRALLAQGASGSSVVISLEDVVSLWLNELEELGFDPTPRMAESGAGSMRPPPASSIVKLEPTPVSIPSPSSSFAPGLGSQSSSGGLATLHPPAPYDAFLPPPSAGPSALPQVTAALISYLPAEPIRTRYLKAFRETMLLHPSFNVPHFEQRIVAVYTWAETGETSSTAAAAYGSKPMTKADLARDIFFSSAKPGSSSRANGATAPSSSSNTPKPTLSFFSAACAAFALGALVARDDGLGGDPSGPSPPSPSGPGDASGTPAMLFALSEQSLQLFEKTAAYDIDSVIAMILQVLYMLYEGQMSVAQGVFPLVGKMVNVARMMGLAMDPDEFLGTYNLFEAETRRRIWWEVFYFDLFAADCMGQPPLIADNTHTTRLPADVDEDKFTPSCVAVPEPDEFGSAPADASSVYFSLKCRLAQLVKNVKKQTFRDPLADDSGADALSIEQAGAFEADVAAFLQELPAAFRLDFTDDLGKPVPALGPGESPARVAQKCELAIVANRMIVKLYLPFLKEAAASRRPCHQAVFGTISAAHNIVCAAKVVHAVWKGEGAVRPAMFDFYDFGRTVFDAAVVCAHAVVQEPMSIMAAEGMKSVVCALEILREIGTSRMGVEGTRNGGRSEAVRIVEVMKRKAEAARGGGAVGTAGAAGTAGTKRKHVEVEEREAFAYTQSFQLPFVGAAVSSSRTERPRPAGARPNGHAHGKDDAGAARTGKPEAKKQARERDRERDREKDKDKDKDNKEKEKDKQPPPLRVRHMTGQPAPRRQRTASVSVSASTANAGAGATLAPAATPGPSAPALAPSQVQTQTQRPAPPPPSPLTLTTALPVQVQVQVQPQPQPQPSSSVPQSPSVATPYDSYIPSGPQQQQQQQQQAPPTPQQQQQQHSQPPPQLQPQEDYMQYSSSPDDGMSDERRFSVSYDSPASASSGAMYDQSQYASPATAYPPPPPASASMPPPGGYYMSYAPPSYVPGPEAMGMMEGYPPARGMEYQAQPQQPHSHSHSQQQHPGHVQHQHQHQHQQPQHPQHAQHQHQPQMVAIWPQQGDPGAGGEMWTDYKFYS